MRHLLKLHRDLDTNSLPQADHDYTIETFNPAVHKQQWLDLNNLVFSHHPDQGNWVMQDLDNRMAESWFDEKGFFLATENGTIEGFVWTKIHQDLINQDPVGELYVVGTHPDHAGKGIARALSVEAINYLVDKGLKHAILYVDADNEKGLKLYDSLGFNQLGTHRMKRLGMGIYIGRGCIRAHQRHVVERRNQETIVEHTQMDVLL